MARTSALSVVTADDEFTELIPPKFNVETGSSYGWEDRLFYGWDEKGSVFDYGDLKARDYKEMLKRDYKARQIESVLSLPIMSAEYKWAAAKGDAGELDWWQGYLDADRSDGGCEQSLQEIIGGHTTAFTYSKAFWELVFDLGYDNRVVYRKVAFRPADTCRLMRDPRNGEMTGFQQEAYAAGPMVSDGMFPIVIPNKRAYVYVHNQRMDPLNGSSDLDVAHWCYKTKQKLLFLWMQFLESVALPRTIVRATDIAVANEIAGKMSKMRNSGILPIGTNGNNDSVAIDTQDASGKGAEQFKEAIAWLDQAATNSVLAGFLDLTGAAANGIRGGGGGSYALSKDASDYFLQFEEAKTHEIERSIRHGLAAPLIRYNFGRHAAVPKLKFEPLNDEDKSNQITMLTALMASKGPANIPTEFIAMLAQQVANYFGMDETLVHDAFVQAGKDAAAQAAQISAAGASPLGQQAATMAGATDAATTMVKGGGKKPLPPELQSLPWDKL